MRCSVYLVVLAACGSSTSSKPDAPGSAPSVACDVLSGGDGHMCTDYDIADQPTEDGLRASCANNSGTLVTACSHAGAAGGCRIYISGEDGAQGTQITWYYDLTTKQVMSLCGGMFVTP